MRGHDVGRQDRAAAVVEDEAQAGGVDGGDLAGGSVVDPLTILLAVEVQEEPVAFGVAPLAGSPGGPGHLGAGEPADGSELASDSVGEILAVDVGHGQHGDRGRRVIADVDDSGGGELVAGLLGCRGAVLPALAGAGRLAAGEGPGAVRREGGLLVGVVLAAVDRQLRRAHLAMVGESGPFGGETAGSDGAALILVPEAPQRCAGRGRDCIEDRGGGASGDLGDFVEHDHRPGRQRDGVEAPAGDG